MFMAQIALNPRHKDVSGDLNDRNRLHQKIMAFYPEYNNGAGIKNARSRFGVQFRPESASEVIVLSRIAPEASVAPPGYKLITVKDLTSFHGSISAGRVYRFRLDARPSYWPSGARNTPKGRRESYDTPEECENWLRKQGARLGFEVVEVSLMAQPPVTVSRWSGNRLQRWTFTPVRFDGYLKVLDPETLRKALQDGIGEGKTWGLGLLSIAREKL